MSLQVKPYYRMDYDSYLNVDFADNVLTIYNGGLYPKDYFEYSATIDLSQIVPYKRYMVCSTENGTIMANFDENLNFIDHKFYEKFFHYTYLSQSRDIVVYKTQADEVYILSRCRLNSAGSLNFVKDNQSFSKIIRNTSLDNQAYSKYMEDANAMDYHIWINDDVTCRDQLEYINVQADALCAALKTVIDSTDGLRASLDSAFPGVYSVLSRSVQPNSYIGRVVSTEDELASVMDTKDKVRDAQYNYKMGNPPYVHTTTFGEALDEDVRNPYRINN